MITIHSQYEPADDLLKNFVKENDKFKSRFVAIFESMKSYIERSGYQEKVTINELVLGYTLLDYFEDIQRLKDFHRVPHINSVKLVSYMTYWLLRRKPIQVILNDADVLYVNERFALAYLLEFLNDDSKTHILLRKNDGLASFLESLLYYFKYRHFNAQDIEMIILAFFAGRIYQSDDVDISSELPVSDYAEALDDN